MCVWGGVRILPWCGGVSYGIIWGRPCMVLTVPTPPFPFLLFCSPKVTAMTMVRHRLNDAYSPSPSLVLFPHRGIAMATPSLPLPQPLQATFHDVTDVTDVSLHTSIDVHSLNGFSTQPRQSKALLTGYMHFLPEKDCATISSIYFSAYSITFCEDACLMCLSYDFSPFRTHEIHM